MSIFFRYFEFFNRTLNSLLALMIGFTVVVDLISASLNPYVAYILPLLYLGLFSVDSLVSQNRTRHMDNLLSDPEICHPSNTRCFTTGLFLSKQHLISFLILNVLELSVSIAQIVLLSKDEVIQSSSNLTWILLGIWSISALESILGILQGIYMLTAIDCFNNNEQIQRDAKIDFIRNILRRKDIWYDDDKSNDEIIIRKGWARYDYFKMGMKYRKPMRTAVVEGNINCEYKPAQGIGSPNLNEVVVSSEESEVSQDEKLVRKKNGNGPRNIRDSSN